MVHCLPSPVQSLEDARLAQALINVVHICTHVRCDVMHVAQALAYITIVTRLFLIVAQALIVARLFPILAQALVVACLFLISATAYSGLVYVLYHPLLACADSGRC